MAKALLTDAKIKNAKPLQDGKSYKLTDGEGLFLRVMPSGAKLWQMKYRLAGKEQSYSIGQYPEVSLQLARVEHAKARLIVKEGEHPRARRELEKLEKAHAGADTLKGISLEWISEHAPRWGAYYKNQTQRALEADVFPTLGNVPIKGITALHIRPILGKIVDRGAPVVAENVRRSLSQVFRYAVAHGRAELDPAAALKGMVVRPKVKHNLALTPLQLPDLLNAAAQYGGNRTTKIAIELLLRTFVRTGELRAAEWSEFDLEGGQWRVPAARMKMEVEHLVPLSLQSIALLVELSEITGSSRWLFPNYRRPETCMTATTINRALERMGFAGKGSIGFSAHGFRGTASTILHELGYSSEIIERQLAHAERNKVKASYNKAQYLDRRSEMMQDWSDLIDKYYDESGN